MYKRQGLYFGFDKLPGPAVSTPEKLGELLKDLPGVAASCKEKYEKAREQICPRDDGKACKRIAEVLLDGKAVSYTHLFPKSLHLNYLTKIPEACMTKSAIKKYTERMGFFGMILHYLGRFMRCV